MADTNEAQPAAEAHKKRRPSAPRDLKASAGNDRVLLHWKAPSSNGGAHVTGYVVDVWKGKSHHGKPDRKIHTHSSGTRHAVVGLKNGQEYTFVVFAVNSVGQSRGSNAVHSKPHKSPHPVPHPHPTPHPTPMAIIHGRRSAGKLPSSWRRTSSTRPQGPPRG